ncbi:reverse transcriptase domain-containing protein [Tanacetum coccineum]
MRQKELFPPEKLALFLVNMTRRLRRYFEAHPVKVITDQPIKNILSRVETSGKLAKYAVEIGTYKISFIPRNAIKGQVLADFLSDAPDGEVEEEYFRMPEVTPEVDDTEVWTLFTDGAASLKGSGAGLVLIGPSGLEYTYALLRFKIVNYKQRAENEALLAGLRIARKMKVSGIEVKVDSKLVANQINGTYEATKESMIKYLAKAKEFISKFKTFSIENIPREDNQKADILSKLATVPFSHLTKEILVEVLNERSTDAKEVQTIVEEEGENWMTPIIKYLEEGIAPSDKNEARSLRAKISQYVIESGVWPFQDNVTDNEAQLNTMRRSTRSVLNLDLLQNEEAAAITKAKYKTKMETSRMENRRKVGTKIGKAHTESQKHFDNSSYKLQHGDKSWTSKSLRGQCLRTGHLPRLYQVCGQRQHHPDPSLGAAFGGRGRIKFEEILSTDFPQKGRLPPPWKDFLNSISLLLIAKASWVRSSSFSGKSIR